MSSQKHSHPTQKEIEDSPFTEKMILAQSVEEIIIEKQIVSADTIRKQLEELDNKNPMLGAQLIAHSWKKPKFKSLLLEDVNKAAMKLGIDTGQIPIRAVENTSQVHNIIVCTLCSCYPRMLLGLPPDWYKSRVYRSRAVKEPRNILAEFGTIIPQNIEVRVHDSTADLRYIVLPKQPDGTQNWNIDQLKAIITRDCMIGVSTPTLSATVQ